MPKTCGCCLEEERVETHVGEAFSAPKLFSCLGPAREWLKLLPDCVFEMKEGSKVLVIWNLLPCLNSQGLSTGSLAIFRAPRIRKLSRGCERASPGLNALEANDQPDSMGLKVSAHRLCKESRVGAKQKTRFYTRPPYLGNCISMDLQTGSEAQPRADFSWLPLKLAFWGSKRRHPQVRMVNQCFVCKATHKKFHDVLQKEKSLREQHHGHVQEISMQFDA